MLINLRYLMLAIFKINLILAANDIENQITPLQTTYGHYSLNTVDSSIKPSEKNIDQDTPMKKEKNNSTIFSDGKLKKNMIQKKRNLKIKLNKIKKETLENRTKSSKDHDNELNNFSDDKKTLFNEDEFGNIFQSEGPYDNIEEELEISQLFFYKTNELLKHELLYESKERNIVISEKDDSHNDSFERKRYIASFSQNRCLNDIIKDGFLNYQDLLTNEFNGLNIILFCDNKKSTGDNIFYTKENQACYTFKKNCCKPCEFEREISLINHTLDEYANNAKKENLFPRFDVLETYETSSQYYNDDPIKIFLKEEKEFLSTKKSIGIAQMIDFLHTNPEKIKSLIDIYYSDLKNTKIKIDNIYITKKIAIFERLKENDFFRILLPEYNIFYVEKNRGFFIKDVSHEIEFTKLITMEIFLQKLNFLYLYVCRISITQFKMFEIKLFFALKFFLRKSILVNTKKIWNETFFEIYNMINIKEFQYNKRFIKGIFEMYSRSNDSIYKYKRRNTHSEIIRLLFTMREFQTFPPDDPQTDHIRKVQIFTPDIGLFFFYKLYYGTNNSRFQFFSSITRISVQTQSYIQSFNLFICQSKNSVHFSNFKLKTENIEKETNIKMVREIVPSPKLYRYSFENVVQSLYFLNHLNICDLQRVVETKTTNVC